MCLSTKGKELETILFHFKLIYARVLLKIFYMTSKIYMRAYHHLAYKISENSSQAYFILHSTHIQPTRHQKESLLTNLKTPKHAPDETKR